jgi:hypothetical protein
LSERASTVSLLGPTVIDFLFPGGNEPHGYEEFMATVDALVIGRKTYAAIRSRQHARHVCDTLPPGGAS